MPVINGDDALDDALAGTLGDDTISGLGGADTLSGGDGADSLDGGAGDDSLDGGLGDDVLAGGAGNDALSGGVGDDVFLGGAGADTATDDDGFIRIDVGDDNDRIVAWASAASQEVLGGAGDDDLVVFHATTSLNFDGGDGSDRIGLSLPSMSGATINGGLGNDTITVSGGRLGPAFVPGVLTNSTINAGAGDDQFVVPGSGPGSSVSLSSLVVDMGAGDDTVAIVVSDSVIDLGEGANLLSNNRPDAGYFNVTVTAGSGADTSSATLDGSSLSTGDGADLIGGSVSNSTVNAGGGADMITATLSQSLIDGGAGADTITRVAGDSTISGGADADRFVVIPLGAGAPDSLTVITDFDPASEVLDIAANVLPALTGFGGGNPFGGGFLRVQQSGADTLLQWDQDGAANGASFTTLLTLRNVDQAALTSSNFGGYDPHGGSVAGQVINGDDALDDVLPGTLGDDTISGLGGADTLSGADGADSLVGGAGDDALDGGLGDDVLAGGADNDSLSGGVGDDRLSGGAGADTIADSDGFIQVDGGDDNDAISVWASAASQEVLGGAGDDSIVVTNATAPLSVDGGDGSDSITIVRSNLTGLTIEGGLGNDAITISGGGPGGGTSITNSTIDAGVGDDLLQIPTFGPGSSVSLSSLVVDMGDGDDTVAMVVSDSVIDLGEGANLLRNGRTDSGYYGVTITAGSGADTSTATLDGSSLSTGDGADRIEGQISNSTVNAGGGADMITATFSQSLVDGGAGADTITHVAGDSTISGGADADRFVVTPLGAGAPDSLTVITDFDPATEVLDIATSLLPALSGFGGDPFGTGFLRVQQSGADTLLQWDQDGAANGASFTTLLTLKNVDQAALTSSNFGGYDPHGGGVAGQVINGDDALDDALAGTLGDDTISGLGGADTLSGGDGADSLDGGAGDDSLDGGLGDDVLAGGAGNDALSGGVGDDVFLGGAGADTATDDDGFIRIDVGDDNDRIVAWASAASQEVLGGAGDDDLVVFHATTSLNFDGGDGSDRIGLSLPSMSGATINGGLGNDTITVSGGRLGPAFVPGVLTNSTINAGAGDDQFVVPGSGPGSSVSLSSLVVDMGAGDDTVAIVVSDSVIDLGEGANLLSNNRPDAGYFNVTVTAGSGADTSTATLDGSQLSTGDGADLIGGSVSNSTVNAGGGGDMITATLSQSLIDGGAGADTVTRVAGDSTISGGADADRFVVIPLGAGAPDSLTVITDFDPASEVLDIATSLLPALTGYSGGGSPFGGGFLRVQQSGADTLLQWDQDGAANGASFTTLLTLRNVDQAALTSLNFGGYDPHGGGPNLPPTNVSLSNATVNENAANGTVVGVLAGSDPNPGDVLSFSLIDNAGGRFVLDAATKEIRVADGSKLDFETAQTQTIIVRATDAGGLSFNKTLTINVADVVNGDAVVMPPASGGASSLTYTAGSTFDTVIGSTNPNVTETLNISVPLTGGSGGTTPRITPSADGATLLFDFDGDGVTDLNVRGIEDVFLNGDHVVIAGNLAGTGLAQNTIHFAGTGGPDLFDASGIVSRNSVAAQGAAGADNLLGGAGDDRLDGGAGDDTLSGGSGADTLNGGDGADLLTGGVGGDRLDGGAGEDTVDYSAAPLESPSGKGVTIKLDNNSNNRSDATGDNLFNVENVRGGAYDDSLRGDAGANKLWGGGGADDLNGLGGDDTLDGGDGADALSGGLGADALTGGGGADRFVFGGASEISTAGANGAWISRDRILDFQAGGSGAQNAIDRLDLSALDAITKTGKEDAFTYIGANAFSGAAGELRAVGSATDAAGYAVRLIEGDTNGDKVADFQLELHYSGTLDAADFIL